MGYNEDDVRQVIWAVSRFDRKFGAENCNYELFDMGNQLGISVRFPELCMRGGKWRHAERFNIGNGAGPSEAMKRLIEWELAETKLLDDLAAAEKAEMMARIDEIKRTAR